MWFSYTKNIISDKKNKQEQSKSQCEHFRSNKKTKHTSQYLSVAIYSENNRNVEKHHIHITGKLNSTSFTKEV